MTSEPESTLFRALRLVVLLSSGALVAMVQLAITPAITQMATVLGRDRDDGAFLAQTVVTVPALVLAVGAPLIGWLSSLIGKRTVMFVSLLVFAAAGAAGDLLSDFGGLLISRVLVGVAAAGYLTTSVASIGDYYAGAARDKLISWFAIVSTLGALATTWVAGQVSTAYGWHAQFLLYLVGAPLLLLAVFTIRPPRHVAVQAGPNDSSIRGAASILAAWQIYGIAFALGISMYIVSLHGAFLLARKGYPDPTTVSNVLIFQMTGSMLGAFVFSFVRPALGFPLVLAVVCATFGIGNIGFVLTNNLAVLAALAGLVGFGGGLLQPLTQTSVLNMVSPQAAAGAVGAVVGCVSLGQFVNPPVIEFLSRTHGAENAVVDVGLASLGGAVLAMAWWGIGVAHRRVLPRPLV